MCFAENIDINSSSGVEGINSRICKIMLTHIPGKFQILFANSLFTGYFPSEWTLSKVKLLPKSGDLSNPNNWRPISMTNVFSKLMEKIVHRQMLKYLLENRMISDNHLASYLAGQLMRQFLRLYKMYIVLLIITNCLACYYWTSQKHLIA